MKRKRERPTRRSNRKRRRAAHPTVRFRIDFGPESAIGPGKIDLLEQIARAGSLSKAARDNGMSYRRAWMLLDSLNSSFAKPVAVTRMGGYGGGGGVTLTPFGERLIRLYRAFESEVQTQAARHFGRFRAAARIKKRTHAAALVVHLSDRKPRHVAWTD